jgi:hypothetical protein
MSFSMLGRHGKKKEVELDGGWKQPAPAASET